MKSINFISTLSSKQHKQLIRWYQTSFLLIIALLISISIITFKQYHTLSRLKQEQLKNVATVAMYDAALSAKQALKKEEILLKKKFETISQFTSDEKNAAAFLATLQKSIGESAWLESIILEKSRLSMVILCSNSAQVTQIMHDIQLSPYVENLSLLSLHPKEHEGKTYLRMTMRALWKMR